MPRFFFGLREGDTFKPDGTGIELADLAAVRREAMRGARDIMAEAIRRGRPADSRVFEISDETGQVVHVLPFRDVLRLP